MPTDKSTLRVIEQQAGILNPEDLARVHYVRRDQSGTGAFHQQFTFHLRQAGHHVEEEATSRGFSIDAVGEALKMQATPQSV